MRREDEGAGHRHARLERLILQELRTLLREDVADPALVEVRITTLVLSVDYRHARIHFVVRGDMHNSAQERVRVERALGRAMPYLRAQLAIAIEMKRVPELRFAFDGMVPVDDKEEPCE